MELTSAEQAVIKRHMAMPWGIPVGTAIDRLAPEAKSEKASYNADLLMYDGIMHMLCVAGSGGGKTLGFVIPAALRWPSSMVVLDVKGEISAATADVRRAMGQRVVIVGPGEQPLNPLQLLEDCPEEELMETASMIAAWLVPLSGGEGGSGNEKFFVESSRRIVSGILMDMHYQQVEMRFSELASRLFLPLDKLQEYLGRIADDDCNPGSQKVGSMVGGDMETFGNIMANLAAATEWMTIPRLLRSVENGVRPEEILDGKATVYLNVKPETLETHPGLVRMQLGALLRTIMQRKVDESAKPPRTLFMLDEMPQLRQMETLMTALNVGRGYGITLAGVIQSLAQLERHYGKTGLREWLDSTDIKILGRMRDQETLEWASKQIGVTSIVTTSGTSNTGGSGGMKNPVGGTNASGGASTQIVKRELMTADEIRVMPFHHQIVVMAGQNPILAGKPAWAFREDMQALVAAAETASGDLRRREEHEQAARAAAEAKDAEDEAVYRAGSDVYGDLPPVPMPAYGDVEHVSAPIGEDADPATLEDNLFYGLAKAMEITWEDDDGDEEAEAEAAHDARVVPAEDPPEDAGEMPEEGEFGADVDGEDIMPPDGLDDPLPDFPEVQEDDGGEVRIDEDEEVKI